MYRMSADLIVLIHLAYASFVVLGLLAIVAGAAFRWDWVRNFWFRVIHLLLMGSVAAESVFGVPCPLTVWEKQLRDSAGQTTYAGSFLGKFAHDFLFIDAPQWAFTAAYLAFFVVVVWAFAVARPRWPWARTTRDVG